MPRRSRAAPTRRPCRGTAARATRPRARARRASAACLAAAAHLVGLHAAAVRSPTSPPCARTSATRRARATRTPENMVASAAPNSPGIAPGCLTSSSRIDRSIASGRKLSQCNGTAAAGAYASRRCSGRGPRRAGRCGDACAPARRRVGPGDAVGRRTARAPRARRRRGGRPGGRARRGRGASSTVGSAGSNPSSDCQTACRTRMAAGSRPSTSLSPSCWPWSSSSATIGTLRPRRVIVRPKPAMRSGSSHSMSFGPATATDFAVSSVATQRRRAPRAPARSPRRAARARRRPTQGASSTRSPARTASPNESALLQLDDVGGAGGGDSARARRRRPARQHDDERVGSAHLRTDRVEGAPEVVAAVAHDEDGGDSGEHRGQPKRPPPRHPSTRRARHETIEIALVSRRAGPTRRRRRVGRSGSDRALAQLAALALGESAPDAEALVVREGVLEALARAPRIRCRSSSRPASSRPSRGRTPPDRSARTARRSAMPADCRRRRPAEPPERPA